jgi:hypothetical protein
VSATSPNLRHMTSQINAQLAQMIAAERRRNAFKMTH